MLERLMVYMKDLFIDLKPKPKNMRFLNLVVTCAVLFVGTVSSQNEINIKRSAFPFMAFVYYPDLEQIKTKFTRSAVLIQENWLITSSLDNADTSIGFPKKTLVARLGAIIIDAKFTFNEDEGEQEREIIQIVRPYPYNVNATEWWNTDISLLKTLLPFNMTSVVATITAKLNKFDYGENCFILFYAKQNENSTDDKILMQMSVELLPSSVKNCGDNFKNETMLCASQKDTYIDADFCEGNSGGPLICNSQLTGIQTYITNCKEPYLYQRLNAWDDLITCGTEEKCQEEQCARICFNINKDPLTDTTAKIIVTEEILAKLVDGYYNETNTELSVSPTFTTVEKNKETLTTKTTLPTIIEEEVTTKTTILLSVTHTTNTIADTSTTSSTSEEFSSISSTAPSTSESSENSADDTTDYSEERQRKTNVLAKQHGLRNATSTLTIFSNIMYIFFVVMWFI